MLLVVDVILINRGVFFSRGLIDFCPREIIVDKMVRSVNLLNLQMVVLAGRRFIVNHRQVLLVSHRIHNQLVEHICAMGSFSCS